MKLPTSDTVYQVQISSNEVYVIDSEGERHTFNKLWKALGYIDETESDS